jgi:HAD superfamily hydrolase (TIGR01509 family)
VALFKSWVPRAIVFDCDGVLVDTEPCWTIAETEIFGRRGLTFGPAEKSLMIGRSSESAAAVMAGLFDECGRESSIEHELLSTALAVIADSAEPMAGAQALVEITSAFIPVAVASNSPRVILDAALERGGFSTSFPISVSGDEVLQPKPDPEIYTVCCAHLAVKPEDALAFEDSIPGVASARGAGLRVIGVPTLAEDELHADHIVDSLAAPDLVEWVREWSS